MPEITTERVKAPVDRILVDGLHVCSSDIRDPAHLECLFLRFGIACTAPETPVHLDLDPKTYTTIPHPLCPISREALGA